MNDFGVPLAASFRAKGFYVYGIDQKEDYDGICDRSLRFDIHQFVTDADYRIRFTQIFEEIIPRLDALVNMEEINLKGHLNEIQLDHWQQSVDVNLTGPMLLSKLFLPKLEKSKGAILNIGSVTADSNKHGQLAFMASKNALNGLTKALAFDLKGRVIVNGITVVMGNEKENFSLKESNSSSYANELAKLAVYLVVENAGYVHGKNILLDGVFLR